MNLPNIEPFYLNDNLIYSACKQTRNKDYHFSAHAHDTMEFYLITKGACSMDIQGESIKVKKNELIMILPFIKHSLKIDETCEFFHLHLNFALLKKLLYRQNNQTFSFHSLIATKQCTYYQMQSNQHIIDLFKAILTNFNNNLHQSFLSNLYCLELITLIHQHAQTIQKEVIDTTSNKYQYVAYTYEYLHQNYNNKILIDDIASRLHISSRYLSSLFYEYSKQTIIQYLNNYRINKAIELMANTNESLTEIALSVGLNNAQNFSKVFHTIIGEKPSTYRKKLKKS